MTKEDLVCLIGQAIQTYEKTKVKPFGDLEDISKNMAEKAYGSSNINRWILEGRVKPVRLGKGKTSKLSIKLSEIYSAIEKDTLDELNIKERKC